MSKQIGDDEDLLCTAGNEFLLYASAEPSKRLQGWDLELDPGE